MEERESTAVTDATRFWNNVDVREPNECWPWKRALGRKTPHGRVRVGSKLNGTRRLDVSSRVAWTLTHGSIPPGQCVLHSCDNPPCCNPRHLWLGTLKDNSADMRAKGRARGVCGQHPKPG